MAWYKYEQFLKKSPHDAYDHEYQPGAAVKLGLRRDTSCPRKTTTLTHRNRALSAGG